MRIVAGEFRGRRLKAPEGRDTRPTTDRVREALFSSLRSLLGADLGGRAVLDPFAGSGALGLEALSRGAARVTLVERDRKALVALRSNVETLGATERARVIAGDALRLASRGGFPGSPFSLLLLDPPYRIDATEVGGLLETLASSEALEDSSVITWEHATGDVMCWPPGFRLHAQKRYGSTEIDIAIFERGPDAS